MMQNAELRELLNVHHAYDQWQAARDFRPLAIRVFELAAFDAGWEACLRALVDAGLIRFEVA